MTPTFYLIKRKWYTYREWTTHCQFLVECKRYKDCIFFSSQKRAVSDNNDAVAMIYELKSYINSCCYLTICDVLYRFLQAVLLLCMKRRFLRKFAKKDTIFGFLETTLNQHICSRLKVNYLWKMLGYPQFFSRISMALVMIFIFCIVVNLAKYLCN